RPASAGLGRSSSPQPRLCATRAPRSFPPPARAGAGRLSVLATGERSRNSRLRERGHAAQRELPELAPVTVPQRVESLIRRLDLIPPGGAVTCLVSGGADSTCLWHVLRELGYDVSALHVAHGLRGAESDEDARFCREQLG